MGAMTSTYMAFHYADEFDYFGIFSGTNIGNATFAEDFAYDGSLLQNRVDQTIALAYLQEVDENIVPSEDLLNAVVFTMAGNVDTAVYANGFAHMALMKRFVTGVRNICRKETSLMVG